MSEPILIALVQLFAIVAASRHQQLSDKTRYIIKSYLKQYLNNQEVEEYLLLYDELYTFHDINDEDADWGNPDTLEKMGFICQKINKGLQQKDKIVVFIKFVEFVEEIKANDNVIEQRDSTSKFPYYQVIRDVFSISEDNYESICSFILKPYSDTQGRNNWLRITSEKDLKSQQFKQIYQDRLEGEILVLYLENVNLMIGRYYGSDDLYLNGHYIARNQSFLVNPGTIIKSQKILPIYYTDIASKLLVARQDVTLQYVAKDIAYSFKNSKNGIKPFSFEGEGGELIGVMGGSGTGKSTLLNLLNGSLNPQQGDIFINGYDFEHHKEALKPIIGYIPQDDLLIDELTVFQNMYFNARLCFGNYSKFKLMKLILRVLINVDLIGIRDLVVGSPLNKVISGGQRKRLNIALELIRKPYVLFADEPTSGLSSMDSEMVMLLLKEQTLKGRMVTVNIHQPSSNIFKLFDKLLILDKGGYPIYYGNPIDSIAYFKSVSNHVNRTEGECLSCGYVNPEQLFEITESKTINKHGQVTGDRVLLPEKWYDKFTKILQPKLVKEPVKNDLPKNQFNVPSALKQFKIFSLRNIFIKLTNRQYILLNLLEAPFLAFILAFLIRFSSTEGYEFGMNKNFMAYLFMSVVVALFLGMMVSADEIIKDRKILKREAFLTLSRLSYLNSKILFLFALSAVQMLLFVLVGNLILGIEGMYFSYWLILFSTACFANMVGLNISSGLNSIVNIYIVIPFVLIPQLLLSGVIVPFDRLNPSIRAKEQVPFIGNMMASRWAFEAQAVVQFKNNAYTKHFFESDKTKSTYSYYTGYLIPAIRSTVDECHRNISLKQDAYLIKADLALLKKEFKKMEAKSGIAYKGWADLNNNVLNDAVRNYSLRYLDEVHDEYSYIYKNASNEKEAIFERLNAEYGKKGVLDLKQRSYNKDLAALLQNRGVNKGIILGRKGFIRKVDPIYKDAESPLGRAHFYAPTKKVGPFSVSTLWFNVAVLWFMSLLMYATLLHDSLRRIVNYRDYRIKKKRLG